MDHKSAPVVELMRFNWCQQAGDGTQNVVRGFCGRRGGGGGAGDWGSEMYRGICRRGRRGGVARGNMASRGAGVRGMGYRPPALELKPQGMVMGPSMLDKLA